MRMLLALLLWSPPALAADLEAICTWTGAGWQQSAHLRLPGTDVAFANVWSGDDTRVDGTLGVDWRGPVFAVQLTSPTVVVSGDIDPNNDAVFNLDDVDVALGPSAVLVHGARFAVLGSAPGGGVLVGPYRWATERVWSPTAVGIVPCEDVTVHWRSSPSDEVMLAAVGFAADSKVMELPKGRSTRLHASPEGPLLGIIQKEKYARRVRVAEERDGWSRIAMVHWTGTAWHGWVESRRLVEPVYGEGGGILGGIGAGGAEPIPVRRCDADVPLRAKVGSHEAVVGTVKAGAPFVVASEGDEFWSVTFPSGWIAPAGKASLRVAAVPSACPEGTWTASSPDLGALIDSAQ